MFIQTEETPNPATCAQVSAGHPCHALRHTADFTNAEAAARSPLAARLLAIDGVEGVFLGSDFITVTSGGPEWHVLKPPILGVIMEHFTAGLPVIDEEVAEAPSGGDEEGEDTEIVAQIKELLDTRVRPAVAQDGGDIIFHRFDSGIVYLHMQGSCSGCPSSTMTLKSGIENLLKHYIPEVEAVEAVETV